AHRQPRARFQRRLDKIVPIAVLALDGEERFTWLNAARVDRKSGHAPPQRARTLRLHGGRHGIKGPERFAHATFSLSAAATASWSLNGNTASPTIWPLSWPLPAISSTSPDCRLRIALPIACARSAISAAPGAAARMAARIAAGFSLRGW